MSLLYNKDIKYALHPELIAMEREIFRRVELALGRKVLEKIASTKVALFGVGGVGSWCADALIRTGIMNLTIVDPDKICESNINRQLMATSETVSQFKVNALEAHLTEVNPLVRVNAMQISYNEQSASEFDLNEYDYVVDAIDGVKDKSLLIINACKSKTVFFSSMGAALKLDPSKVKVAEFWEVNGCPLARALRSRFKKEKVFPSRKFKCVYGGECISNNEVGISENEGEYSRKANGSLCHITGIFGFTLAGLIIQDISCSCACENM